MVDRAVASSDDLADSVTGAPKSPWQDERRERRVLVTDGEQRAALAVVRSLGRAGYSVYVSSRNGRSVAGASRYAMADIAVADALSAPDTFAADVRRLLHSHDIGILLPITDGSLLAVLPEEEKPNDVVIPTAGINALRLVCDKAAVLEMAARLGISTPRQITVESGDALRVLRTDTLSYPVVLKPSRSVGERADGRTKVGVSYAASRDELLAAADALDEGSYPLLVQERIEGPGIGIFLLRWNGETIATFAHRRLREKPPSGGVSVYSESVVADPELVRLSQELVARLGWFGVAMVEFKVDRATGKAYLMEINPRFWGSLQLAVDAGVDFPRLLCEVARGERPAPVTTYRVGLRSRWWWGDVDHLLTRFRRSASSLALPADAPSRREALAQFLTWRRTDRNDTWRVDDLGPFWRESTNRFLSSGR